MELLIPLRLPILLSAAAVWVVSIIFGMALPHHKQDFIVASSCRQRRWVALSKK